MNNQKLVKSLEFCGHSSTTTTLDLFPKPANIVSLIYGPNGSGKTTISNELKQGATAGTLRTHGGSSAPVDLAVHVFNEEFIRQNVEVREGEESPESTPALNTIVMVGKQVDEQHEVDRLLGELEGIEKTLGATTTPGSLLQQQYTLQGDRQNLEKGMKNRTKRQDDPHSWFHLEKQRRDAMSISTQIQLNESTWNKIREIDPGSRSLKELEGEWTEKLARLGRVAKCGCGAFV